MPRPQSLAISLLKFYTGIRAVIAPCKTVRTSSVNKALQEIRKSKRALSVLAEIKADEKKQGISPGAAIRAALKDQKEARRERKISRR